MGTGDQLYVLPSNGSEVRGEYWLSMEQIIGIWVRL